MSHEHLVAVCVKTFCIRQVERLEAAHLVVFSQQFLHSILRVRTVVHHFMAAVHQLAHLCEKFLGCEGLQSLVGKSCLSDELRTIHYVLLKGSETSALIELCVRA